ncbi:glycoside hydrolase family 9 protein [Paenibacillus dokdonensis]|uniref:Endoglucanase n=1 Tax=Paenibacillus dokdonensis TaxID=2567944 RepID=A0ABU6GPH6_9BACL|nr:glycoside hydrolase family 9 protein [Paenibacillus dokdonensis]MEC0240610.1 glycoside hydrolase family 9 protein [Paenibacillus dokdonensis]
MSMEQQGCIAVNQLGYRRRDAKIAIIPGQGGSFRLVNNESGEPVWQGETSAAVEDKASGETVSRGDFSAWEQPGTYRIESGEGQTSYPFVISDSVYQEAHHALLKTFYYFRCGMELEERYAGSWKHAACHQMPAIVHGDESRRVDAWGGWHDAGDYGKYVVPGAKAVADLLLAYEYYPHAFERLLPLPESNDVIPDVLHECRYELEWMQRMQDNENGGVFHKLTTLNFPGPDIMPEDDTAELYVSPISATATGCFAAVMAKAARIYAAVDASFAAGCLNAAEQAWAWLAIYPEYPGFRNPPEITTGEYGDEQDADERYWAAAELYRTTGEGRYHQAFRQMAEQDTINKYELGWADMGGYGTISYLMSERERDSGLAARLKAGLLQRANELAAVSDQDGYGISLRPEQYIWGSNMLVMNHAMLMLVADRLSDSTAYMRRAIEHVHYLFGANVLGKSYVTGFGIKPILHPHHRPSEGDGVEEPVPGLLSGGPNQGLQDDYAREHLTGRAPAASFADIMESYSTNEVTIYWNSPAVFVLSHCI